MIDDCGLSSAMRELGIPEQDTLPEADIVRILIHLGKVETEAEAHDLLDHCVKMGELDVIMVQ